MHGQLSDGTTIAVKGFYSKSRQGNREFTNEVNMISRLQHPNLMKLFGCCIEGNQLLLVYEYMENNCLAHALFGKHGDISFFLNIYCPLYICNALFFFPFFLTFLLGNMFINRFINNHLEI